MFKLQIITPEQKVFDDDVDEVSVPTVNGQIGILPHHVNLLSQVTAGELFITKAGKRTPYAVTGGFLEVANNTATILADYATAAENISIAKAEEAKKRAEHLMTESATEKDVRIAEFELRKALLELEVGLKHKRRTAV